MLRVGAIDLGTNSVRLLIADIGEGGIHPLVKKALTTRLGHRVYESGSILQESVEKTIETIGIFKKIMEDYGVEQSFGFATSAVRSADNGSEVIEYIEKSTDIRIDILSGEEEALLGYMGVRTHLDMESPLLVVDIGGGSTEIVFGAEGKMLFRKSLELGCVRLTEKFMGASSKGLVSDEEISGLEEYINKTLEEILEETLNRGLEFEIIAIGGTAITLAALKHGVHSIESSRVTLGDLEDFKNRIRVREEKLVEEINSLERGRDDIILSGIVELERILKSLGKEYAIVSARDALEGAVSYKMNLIQ